MTWLKDWLVNKGIIPAYNIGRSSMPQLDDLDRFIRHLDSTNTPWIQGPVVVDAVRPVQSEFNEAKVDDIIAQNKFDKPIILSSDFYIIDGHHRYFAHVKAEKPEINIILLTEMELNKALRFANDYAEGQEPTT